MKPVEMKVVEEGPHHIVYGVGRPPSFRERLKNFKKWVSTILSSL